MLPLAERFVARRVVDLEHGLRPAAARLFGRSRVPHPTIAADEDVQIRVLVPPVLPPVLLHERALHVAVAVRDEHDHQMLQANERAAVLDDVDVLGPPRLIRPRRRESRRETDGLEKVEARAVAAGHREYRAPIALELRERRLLHGAPRGARLRRERQRRTARRAAARPQRVAFLERPAERELPRLGVRVGSPAKRREPQRPKISARMLLLGGVRDGGRQLRAASRACPPSALSTIDRAGRRRT